MEIPETIRHCLEILVVVQPLLYFRREVADYEAYGLALRGELSMHFPQDVVDVEVEQGRFDAEGQDARDALVVGIALEVGEARDAERVRSTKLWLARTGL